MAAAGLGNPGGPAGPAEGIALSERVSATGLVKIGVVCSPIVVTSCGDLAGEFTSIRLSAIL
jgi:hypothetical protein